LYSATTMTLESVAIWTTAPNILSDGSFVELPNRGRPLYGCYDGRSHGYSFTLADKVGLQRKFRDLRRKICGVPVTLGDCCPQNRSHASLYILIPRRPRRYTDAHRRAILPFCRTAPARAIPLHSFDHLPGAGSIAE
jgi:hypothetical protein